MTWGVIRDDMAFTPSGVIWVLANFDLICHSRMQSYYMDEIVACITYVKRMYF